MKNTFFVWLSIFTMAAMCISIISCSDDEEGGVTNETVKKLMSERWLSASGSYNEYSYGADAESSTDCFYFLDEQYGVNVWGSEEVDSYFGTSNNSGKDFFNYSVQGNRIIINYFKGTSQTLTFNEYYLESGGNNYTGIGLTSNDKNNMATWRTQLAEELSAVGYAAAVKSGVLATIKKTDNFHQQLDITSNLTKKYPYKKIEYWIIIDTHTGNSNANQYDEYSYKDNNGLHIDNLFELNNNGRVYLKIYNSIKEKQNSGNALTSDERAELSSVTNILNEVANNTKFEFFVEINGRRFNIPTKIIQGREESDDEEQEIPDTPYYPNIKSTPLTLEAIADGTFTFRNKATGNVMYKIDSGKTQTISANSTKTINVTAGQKVRFFGNNTAYATDDEDGNNSLISSTVDFYVYGNIMSLVNSTNFSTTTVLAPYAFTRLFYGNKHLKNHPSNDLILPALVLASYCYRAMFGKCTNLTTAPELPAATMASYCYSQMFSGCSSLTTAPKLPATTLDSFCYTTMFSSCSSLTTAPKLPATTLAPSCYSGMFKSCTKLTAAPELPATTLASNCYKAMFSSCSSLITAPELPATTLTVGCYYKMFYLCSKLRSVTCLATKKSATDCTYQWLGSVSSTGTFVKATGTSWSSGISGIPDKWTIRNR